MHASASGLQCAAQADCPHSVSRKQGSGCPYSSRSTRLLVVYLHACIHRRKGDRARMMLSQVARAGRLGLRDAVSAEQLAHLALGHVRDDERDPLHLQGRS